MSLDLFHTLHFLFVIQLFLIDRLQRRFPFITKRCGKFVLIYHCHMTNLEGPKSPDSRQFFLRQLAPTYDKLNRYMDVELIPYGHANVSYPRHDNKPVFHCQHGPQGDYNTLIKRSFSLNLISLIFSLVFRMLWKQSSSLHD